MQCPRCRAPMLIIERNQIELDHCLVCHGIWFDGEELELLFSSLDLEQLAGRLKEITSLPTRSIPEKPLPCPRCQRKMEKIVVGSGNHEVLLDRCRRGDGLWFDGGELHAVVAHVEAAGRGAVGEALAFVEEVFPGPTPELEGQVNGPARTGNHDEPATGSSTSAGEEA